MLNYHNNHQTIAILKKKIDEIFQSIGLSPPQAGGASPNFNFQGLG